MAEGKNSFVCYCDWKDHFEDLSDEEAGRLIKHIFRYVTDQNPTAPDRIIQVAFKPIQIQLRKDLKEWEKTKEKLKVAGKQGGKKSGEARLQNRSHPSENEATLHKSKPCLKNEAIEAVNVYANVNANENKLSYARVFEIMRTTTDRDRYSDTLLEETATQFCETYKSQSIGNLGNLVASWVRRLNPDILPKRMIV